MVNPTLLTTSPWRDRGHPFTDMLRNLSAVCCEAPTFLKSSGCCPLGPGLVADAAIEMHSVISESFQTGEEAGSQGGGSILGRRQDHRSAMKPIKDLLLLVTFMGCWD